MNLAMLVLRLIVGFLFVGHGAQKLFGAFGGAGLEGTAAGFDRMGLRPARFHAFTAGCAELGGGLLLALGLVTPLGAALIVAVMTTAVITVHGRNGIWNTEGGFEFNLTLIAAAFALAGAGPGAWSLDGALGLEIAGAGWAVAALGAGVLGAIAAVIGDRLAHRGSGHGAHPHPA